MQENFLIVVFGLPASGKTTFSSHFRTLFPAALAIHADKLESYFSKNSHIDKPDLVAFLRERERQTLKRVEFDGANWKQTRKFMERAVDVIKGSLPVIVEDDLLYRSQRRAFQKISFHHQLPYAECYMDSSVEDCLHNLRIRNKQATGVQLPEDVVVKAHQKLETNLDFQHVVPLQMGQRLQITQEDVLKWLKVVCIVPNDPNDESNSMQPHKSSHQHTSLELIDIASRRFVGKLINEETNELRKHLGDKIVQSHGLDNKKALGKILAKWRKQYMKAREKSSGESEMLKHLQEMLKNCE